MVKKGKKERLYMISAVSERYMIHPQTLRLYEREGLLKPSRTQGNTRLYSDEDLERLELILNLTRNLGINLAGVEVVLNMRGRMDGMRSEMQRFMSFVLTELAKMGVGIRRENKNTLARITHNPKFSPFIIINQDNDKDS